MGHHCPAERLFFFKKHFFNLSLSSSTPPSLLVHVLMCGRGDACVAACLCRSDNLRSPSTFTTLSETGSAVSCSVPQASPRLLWILRSQPPSSLRDARVIGASQIMISLYVGSEGLDLGFIFLRHMLHLLSQLPYINIFNGTLGVPT